MNQPKKKDLDSASLQEANPEFALSVLAAEAEESSLELSRVAFARMRSGGRKKVSLLALPIFSTLSAAAFAHEMAWGLASFELGSLLVGGVLTATYGVYLFRTLAEIQTSLGGDQSVEELSLARLISTPGGLGALASIAGCLAVFGLWIPDLAKVFAWMFGGFTTLTGISSALLPSSQRSPRLLPLLGQVTSGVAAVALEGFVAYSGILVLGCLAAVGAVFFGVASEAVVAIPMVGILAMTLLFAFVLIPFLAHETLLWVFTVHWLSLLGAGFEGAAAGRLREAGAALEVEAGIQKSGPEET